MDLHLHVWYRQVCEQQELMPCHALHMQVKLVHLHEWDSHGCNQHRLMPCNALRHAGGPCALAWMGQVWLGKVRVLALLCCAKPPHSGVVLGCLGHRPFADGPCISVAHSLPVSSWLQRT